MYSPTRPSLADCPPIKGLIENTLLDWEGRIAAIVFLPGCNFRCGYCHSPHLVQPPADMETIPIESVLGLLEDRRGWIDGVVVTGGEPLLHPNLRTLLEVLRNVGTGVKLDTNGASPEKLGALIDAGLVDSVALDVKAPLVQERYEQITRMHTDLDAIRRSIDLLLEGRVDYEFRTTVCPAFTDGDDVAAIAEAVQGAKRYVLQRFQPNNCLDPELLQVKPLMREALREYAQRAAPYVQTCFVRGDPKLPTSG